MEMHIKAFLNKISLVASVIATLILVSILLHPPETCIPHYTPHNALKFPRSTCDSHHHPRPFSTPEKKNHRLWSTSAWLKKVKSYSQVFTDARKFSPTHSSVSFSLLSNTSKTLCLLAGAGQEVMALQHIGVSDVTAIDLVDSPPLVSRADPYYLPFFDDAFDFAFSAQFDTVLFPSRFVAEIERTVRIGGFCLFLVEECTNKEVREIVGLFKRGKFVGSDKLIVSGSKMTRIAVRITNSTAY
ncbi:Phthiotriol/phenolphthiotriol dimycocerosates methyltransferase 1 [Bienertia sinuspersici]